MVRNHKDDIHESHGAVRIAPRGLRERVAKAVVDVAQRFKSDILLCAGSLCIDAKSSMMALMLLEAIKGQVLDVTARGIDSQQAVQALSKVFAVKS
jgi:phosphotransferase system HPr (HPr) family protein